MLLKDLTIYAYHGCFAEETQIGAEYKLDVWVQGDFTLAEQQDDLSKTVDYVKISDIVYKEMQISSKLIEHVANRILVKIFSDFKQVKLAGVLIKKPNPPMNQYSDTVEYKLERTR